MCVRSRRPVFSKRVVAISTAGILAAACAPVLAVPAFPGAEGFGAGATGGRSASADVYHVTSLADTNTTGTLRNAISSAPAAGRTIVFDVCGTITLTSNLSINKSNLTIAGQTAPGGGITLRGRETSISGSNVILRYLRFRPGDINSRFNNPSVAWEGDALNTNGATNAIIDHVSATWGIDESLSSTNSNLITVQNSIIAECLKTAGHLNDAMTGTEDHSMGSLLRYGAGSLSFHHNLYESNSTRNPRVGDNLSVEFDNNVLYNWSGTNGYSGADSEGSPKLNYIGNYVIAGPNTTSNRGRAFAGGGVNTLVYQANNLVDSTPTGTLNGTNTGTAMFGGTQTFAASPFAGSALNPINLDTATVAFSKAVAGVGASMFRDTVDQRIVNNVATNTGSLGLIIDSQNQVGGWSAIPTIARPAGWDSDNDGMPNYWELDRSSNPSSASDRSDITASGYTKLENYLNYIVNTVYWNVDADGDWSDAANWLSTTSPSGADVTPYFGPGITAPRTVTVSAPRTAGMIDFDSAVSYTIAGGVTLTLDDSSGASAINVLSGSHTISAPLNLADDAVVTVLPSTSTLAITSPIVAPTRGLTKTGAGALQLARLNGATLAINSGTVTLTPSGSASSLALLSIAPNATLDLTDNDLILSATSKSSVESHVVAKRLTSSLSTASSATGLGVLSGDEYLGLGNTSFDGLAVQPTDVLVKYTWNGDANLDGRVTFDDYVKIDTGFNSGLTGWLNGDFNYSGVVNFDDYVLIDIAFNQQNGTLARAIEWISGEDRSGSGRTATGVAEVLEHFEQFGTAYGTAFLAAVPEPSALLLAAMGCAFLPRRRTSIDAQPRN